MGITTVECKCGYGLDFATELKQLQVMRHLNRDENRRIDIVSTFMGAQAVPPEYSGKIDSYIDFLSETVLPEISPRKLAAYCDVRCDPSAFSMAQSRRLLIAARDQGLRLKVHAN